MEKHLGMGSSQGSIMQVISKGGKVVMGTGVDGALLEHQEDLLWKALTASLNQEAQVTHITPICGDWSLLSKQGCIDSVQCHCFASLRLLVVEKQG